MPIHMCWNLRFFSSDKLKTPKKNCFLPALNSQIFTSIRALLWRKIVILEFMMNQFHFFSSKKRCKDYWFWHRFNKNCKCTMQKIRNCVWLRFYSKFYWKRIEQIQIVQPECDGIWKLILVYKLLKKILHEISQFKTMYICIFILYYVWEFDKILR